jgi:hypothetical protein
VCGYEKTDLAYVRLSEILNRARRARVIDMDAIRDDGSTVITPFHYDGTEHFWDVVRYRAAHMRLDRTMGQDPRVVVMCEAAGMAPQLGTVCDPYGITVMASGGFDSLTDKFNFAKQLSEGGATEVLHIGDHDPSGVHLFLALMEDVQAFCGALGGDVEFTRLAVTPRQIEQMNLPPRRRNREIRKHSGARPAKPRRLHPTISRRSCAMPSRSGSTGRPTTRCFAPRAKHAAI